MNRIPTMFSLPCGVVSLIVLTACAVPAAVNSAGVSEVPDPVERSTQLPDTKPATFEADRQAILAMLGEYRVSFRFEETTVLVQDYERAETHTSGGYEVVVLVEDSDTFISMQHILVSPRGFVTKHWRQDWTWQADARFEYSNARTWTTVPLDTDRTAGAWTQCVFEVNDAPRYCGTAPWIHARGASSWTSDATLRPLPRRELTTRDDYDVLLVHNRHIITPAGWVHEQDNTKLTRHDDGRLDRVLVREFGFNEYRRIDEFDFQPAYDYWSATKAYWARVREVWDGYLDDRGGVFLDMPADGMPLIVALFELAREVEQGELVEQSRILEAFETHVQAAQAGENQRLAVSVSRY